MTDVTTAEKSGEDASATVVFRPTASGTWEQETARSQPADARLRALPPEPKLDEDGYLWKWIERGLFDPQIRPMEALDVIAHHPSAPWKNGRWDVDHKPYAKAFYAKFPSALGAGER